MDEKLTAFNSNMAGASTTQSTGNSIAIKDEGISLTPAATSLDFTGSGVTATAIGSAVTANIPGGGGGGNTFVVGEDLSSAGTATGTAFTLAHSPVAGTVALYRGGGRQALAASDYTISGANITLTVALVAGELLLADYQY